MVHEYDSRDFQAFQNIFSESSSLASLLPGRGFIYRGQSNADWKLQTTLQRLIDSARKTGAKNESVVDFQQDQLKRFKMLIRGRRGTNPKVLEANELWALGQHYGLATPLLDWTTSPYIALYFAFVEESDSEYRSVWCLNQNKVEHSTKHYNKNSLAGGRLKSRAPEFIVPELDENSRLIVQSGLFTKLGIDEEIEAHVGCLDRDSLILAKLKIPNTPAIRREILLQLNLMNINSATLFPDLEGACKHANLISEGVYLEGIGELGNI